MVRALASHAGVPGSILRVAGFFLGVSMRTPVHPAANWVPALFSVGEGKDGEGEEIGTALIMPCLEKSEVSITSLPYDQNWSRDSFTFT